MAKFLKVLLLLVLLVALTLTTLYIINKDKIYEETRIWLAKELSAILKHPVDIGSVQYIPFQSISIDRLTLSSPDDTAKTIAVINNIRITPDVLSIVKNKQLKTVINIDGLNSNDILFNAIIRTESRPAQEYKKVFDPALVDSAFIIESAVSMEGLTFQDVFGTLEIENMAVSKGKVHFLLNDTEYLAGFVPDQAAQSGYDITLRSKNLGLSGVVVKNGDSIILNDLTGMFYTLRFDLKGEIKDLLSPDVSCTLNGPIETNLETLSSLPGKLGDFARSTPLSGKIKSNLYLKIKGYELIDYEATTTLSANNIRIDKMLIDELTTKITLSEGRIDAPLISGTLYGGTLSSKLKMDLVEKDIPYISSLVINNMDFGLFMDDLHKEKMNVFGSFHTELSLTGYAKVSESAEGKGKMRISDADLGPMPILTPVLGNIYSTLENIFPEVDQDIIYEAFMDFDVYSQKIVTDNLTFLGESLTITGAGYVDFAGDLEFTFQNNLRDPSPQQEEVWHVALRNTIIRFGNSICKTHLRGNIQDPKLWTDF